jgi:transcriptional regulator with XRE-family HTH domain
MFSVENNHFTSWLNSELDKQGWTQSELARRAGLSRGTLSNITSGSKGVGEETCRAIARAFNIPPETVFRAAGILPNHPGTDEDFEELKHLFNQMTDEEQLEFLAMGRLKIDLRAKRGESHETPQARLANI